MTRFEKLAWFWAKVEKFMFKEIKNDINVLTIHFEDIFNKEKAYIGFKKILQFFELDNSSISIKEHLENHMDIRLNKTPSFKIPHWTKWSKLWLLKFNKIAGEMMKAYGYYN